jgi:hypothetical protein
MDLLQPWFEKSGQVATRRSMSTFHISEGVEVRIDRAPQ